MSASKDAPPLTLFALGHGTRSAAAFTELLRAAGVQVAVDIRSYPRSRRHPQFDADAMRAWLAAAGIRYAAVPRLGGFRPPEPARDPAANAGWTHPGFRRYADYTLTEAYEAGIAELLQWAREAPTAFFCSETVPWRCHRQLVSNTLVARGHRVWHLITPGHREAHRLGRYGPPPRVRPDGRVEYPAYPPDRAGPGVGGRSVEEGGRACGEPR
jgi:uncharacterized protein (DUF488 family)